MKQRKLVLALCILLVPVLIWGMARLGPSDGGPEPRDPAAPRTGAASPSIASAPERDDLAGLDIPDDVARLLRDGRSWRAARRLRELVNGASEPALVLVAAKAEAGWGGWSNARALLEGKEWLDTTAEGEGWYVLGRAREEAGDWRGAAEAYGRYLRAAPRTGRDGERAVGELRYGLALLRAGQVDEGVAALERLRSGAPVVAGWGSLLAAEALVDRGDTARVRRLVGDGSDSPAPGRAHRARVEAYRAARDLAGARAVALALRARADTGEARAALGVQAARAALDLGDAATARRELRAVIAESPSGVAAVDAARVLSTVTGLTPDENLAVATVYDRANNASRAAAGYRAFLASSAGTPAQRTEARLRMGRALFSAGRNSEAEAALRPLFDGAPAAVAAEAMLYAGRAQYRGGSRAAAVATWERAAQRFPGAPAAGDGLYLAADVSHDAGEATRARALYQRAATEFPNSPRAGEAAMRLGALLFLARDHAGAARVYDDYRARWPQGPLWLQATYWAGRSHQAVGTAEAARQRWREVRQREALSYYAVRSAERLGERFWPVAMGEVPARDAGAEDRVAEWMRAVDLLRAAGLHAEAEAEAERRVREAGDDVRLLYPLAEALNERAYVPQGTRVGRELQRRGERYNPRLVAILYPFPYRPMIAAEARERGLDPFLVAAVIRQESAFRARAQSGAGARGLMQVMPETGRGLAAGAGIRGWETELLFNPEINVHLGTRFLAAQMRSYGGDLPNVFVAYNAGPGRVTRWRSFPEARDRELFTERIPFEETRDYVKILTRNMAIYRGLYADPARAGSASGDED